jgi:hypothetical protein
MMKKLFFMMALLGFILTTSQCTKDDEDKDTTAPVITLKGSNPQLVNKGDTYQDPGYTATDDKDGDITDKVVVTGNVDTSTEGVYYLKYNVTDAAGNKADEQTREVKVMIF